MRRSMEQLRHDLKTLNSFPHLRAIVDGRVAGPLHKWTDIRRELTMMSEELSDFRMLAEDEFKGVDDDTSSTTRGLD